MNWKDELRKQQIDMNVGSGYAKDLGDSVQFGEGNNSVTIDKGTIPHLVARFRKETQPNMPPLERLTQITMSSGPTDDFVRWYKNLR
jgi:hypothetical protein